MWKRAHCGLIQRRVSPAAPAANTLAHPLAVAPNPVLVYQMGRVGSKSVESALHSTFDRLSLEVPVVHGHYLSNFDELERRARLDLADPRPFMADLESVNDKIRAFLASLNDRKINIISLVRDPIARNVSTFFYALDEFIPDWQRRADEGFLDAEHLHEIYLTKTSFVLSALNWFEEQLQPLFGIDVYSVPFRPIKGYQIYSSPSANLLVIRLEDLDRCAGAAMLDFLGLPDFHVSRVNVGEELRAREPYRLFKTRPLPAEYVQWMYGFKLARHFYTEKELGTFARSWTKTG